MRIGILLLGMIIQMSGFAGCYTQEPRGRDFMSENLSDKSTSSTDATTKPPASEVMKRVAKVYSELEMYSCRGTSVHQDTFEGRESPSVTIPFDLHYEREGNSILKWQDEGEEKIFSFQGKKGFLKEGEQPERPLSDLRDELMAATQASRGWSIFEIAKFVYRDALSLRSAGFFLAMENPQLGGEETLDLNHDCYILTGPTKIAEATMKYWIDKESFLIRKFELEITRRKTVEGKEYVGTSKTTETYLDITAK